MPNIDTILREHVTLQLECIDRLYLNGYQPRLQTDLGVRCFLLGHRGNKIASPALLGEMTRRFLRAMEAFAARYRIPIVLFERGQRKEDVAKARFASFKRQEGVVFIGVAQEKVSSFRSLKQRTPGFSCPVFRFYRAAVFVKQFSARLGRAFTVHSQQSTAVPCRLSTVNCRRGPQARQSLDNGFLSVADPKRAQQLCDRLDADRIDAFFRKWLARLPHPFTRQDRAAGYRYRLSILQMEMSRTEVFDRPLAGRQFFEEVIRENLDLGRPDRVQLLFDRRITRRTPGSFRTRVLTVGVEPTLRVDYKKSRIKQYFKLGRVLRTETTINDTRDSGVGRDIHNLDHLRQIGRHANRRLLAVERLSHNCAMAAPTFERVVLPSRQGRPARPGAPLR